MDRNRKSKGEIAVKAFRIILSICFLFLVVPSAIAQKVTVDFDKSTDFTRYKTYAWGGGLPATNPMIHQRIVAGIETQLAAKGLRKTESNPDLVIFYAANMDTQVSVNAMGGGPFGGWRWGSGTATVQKVPVGQLIVDIGDTDDRKFIFRGTASGIMSSKPEKNEKALNAAIAKMFQNFPPSPGKK